jgi:translation initiation factor IF-3
MRPALGQVDLDTKVRIVRPWLAAGAAVQVTVLLRGREAVHPELGVAACHRFAAEVADLAAASTPEQDPVARRVSMVLTPRRGGGAAGDREPRRPAPQPPALAETRDEPLVGVVR